MEVNKRDSFIFYRSFAEALKELDTEDKAVLFEAICNYGLDMVEPEFSGYQKAVWIGIKAQLFANWQRYENGVKGAGYGTRGGRPKKPQENPKKTPKKPQENPTLTPNVNDNVNVNVNDNDNDNVNDNVCVSHTQAHTRDKAVFCQEVFKFVGKGYSQSDCLDFCNYWTEATQEGTMRFENEEYWNTEARLNSWMRNKRDNIDDQKRKPTTAKQATEQANEILARRIANIGG